jgi:hypothetical protein
VKEADIADGAILVASLFDYELHIQTLLHVGPMKRNRNPNNDHEQEGGPFMHGDQGMSK